MGVRLQYTHRNKEPNMQVHQIGETIAFTTDYSASGVRHLYGEIVGRDWSFDTLVAYTVRTLAGTRYHVNANTMEAGRAF